MDLEALMDAAEELLLLAPPAPFAGDFRPVLSIERGGRIACAFPRLFVARCRGWSAHGRSPERAMLALVRQVRAQLAAAVGRIAPALESAAQKTERGEQLAREQTEHLAATPPDEAAAAALGRAASGLRVTAAADAAFARSSMRWAEASIAFEAALGRSRLLSRLTEDV